MQKNALFFEKIIDKIKIKCDNVNIRQANSPRSEQMKFRSGLVKTDKITDYLEKKLQSMGYEVERKYSGLSDSEYLIVKNSGDMFGKESDDDVEIRISNHDLPPTYDRLYAGDFDVRSERSNRWGANADAIDYEDLLAKFAKKKGYETPDYDRKIKIQHDNMIIQRQNNLMAAQARDEAEAGRKWAMDYAKQNLQDEYKKVAELYAKADNFTGDKRKQIRKQANKILNEIYNKYGK